jgi:hypothetical protein
MKYKIVKRILDQGKLGPVRHSFIDGVEKDTNEV